MENMVSGHGRWKTRGLKNKETGKPTVWGQRQECSSGRHLQFRAGYFILNELVIEKASDISGLNLSP